MKTDGPQTDEIRLSVGGSCLKWISIPPIFTKWLIHTCNLMWPVEGGRLQCQPGRRWSRGHGMCPVTLGNWLNLSCPFHETGIKHPLCLTLGSIISLMRTTVVDSNAFKNPAGDMNEWTGLRGQQTEKSGEHWPSLKGPLHHCHMDCQPPLPQTGSLSTAVKTLNFVWNLLISVIWNRSKHCAGQTTHLMT